MTKDIDILNENSWLKTDYGLFNKKENIKFIKLSNRDSLKDVLRVITLVHPKEKFGIICSSLKERDLLQLKEKRISYCIPDCEIKIFSSKDREFKSSPILGGSFINKFSPTLIVSPTGLEIVDTVLKLDEQEIQKKPSQISHKYGLSQPKISQMMTGFGVKTLLQLKESFLNLELSWWHYAFENSLTKRKMTPFKTKKTRKYSFKDKIGASAFMDKVVLLKKKNIEIEIGGLGYLKALGVLRMSEYDVVVRADQLADIVNAMDLRPAKKGEIENIVFVTPLIAGIYSERLRTRIPGSDARIPEYIRELNLLRYLWGLNYEEGRVKEEKKSLLEKYFNEARKSNY